MINRMKSKGWISSQNLRLVSTFGILLIPALIYLPGIFQGVPFPPGDTSYSDLLITHYPYLIYLKNSLLDFQQIPLWQTLIHSGAPFAANPLAGLFYLPGWLAMLFPLPSGISVTLAAHSVFGAWGMYRFLQDLELAQIGSITGALCFGLMPKLAAHYGAGHVTLLYAISWTPWLLSTIFNDRESWATGLIAGMLFLADPRWAVYSGALFAGTIIAYRKVRSAEDWTCLAKAAGAALMIASPLIIPLLEYLPYTSRAQMTATDIFNFSLPIRGLLGMVIPGSGGSVEWYFYGGGVVLGLVIVHLIFSISKKGNLWWLIVIITSIIISLEPWAEVAEWIGGIPILSLLRVPSRSLFLIGFSFAVLAGSSLDHLTSNPVNKKGVKLLGFGILTFSILFNAGIVVAGAGSFWRTGWGFNFLALFSLLLILIATDERKKFYAIILLLLLVIDLMGASLQAFQIRTEYGRVENEILNSIKQDPDLFRVYSPSYSVAQHEAALENIELTDGVDPLQISAYSDFMEIASGVPSNGYYVTIPKFESGNPDLDNRGMSPESMMLGHLNVKYVISEYEIDSPGLLLNKTAADQYLYVNQNWRRRAWIEQGDNENGTGLQTQLNNPQVTFKSPNRIEIQVVGPGKMILSEIKYPGWSAYLDGEPVSIQSASSVLRAVWIPDGEHHVVFIYHPLSVISGLALSMGGWLLIILGAIRRKFA